MSIRARLVVVSTEVKTVKNSNTVKYAILLQSGKGIVAKFRF